MSEQPSGTALRIGLVILGMIFVVLLVFLLITWIQGDPTNDLEERQPTPSASTSFVQIGDEGQDEFLSTAAGPLLDKLRAAAP